VVTDLRPVLHICLTCQPAGEESGLPGEDTAGARLHQAVSDHLRATNLEETIRINPVNCMANCEQGCSVALSAPGKWTYLTGYLKAELAEDLVTYAVTYGASKSGVVMPSKRPDSLREVIVARVPAHPDEIVALQEQI
jgi:predicted metal-binding protein